MIIYPNAKINIGLNILSKRVDGYHNISSVFYPINDCFDIIEIKKSNKFLFTTSGEKIIGENNLCVDAYKIIYSLFNIPSVHIHLHKQIPIGSGLGGGSSNASFILKGLNKLFDLELTDSELEKMSLDIGADCPFFIDNKPKMVSGIGEIMEPINLDLSNFNIELHHSDIKVSTAEVFSKFKIIKSDNSLSTSIMEPIENWKSKINNDFEKLIFSSYPELEKIKEDFYERGALYSSMTGTGSTVYGIFKKWF